MFQAVYLMTKELNKKSGEARFALPFLHSKAIQYQLLSARLITV